MNRGGRLFLFFSIVFFFLLPAHLFSQSRPNYRKIYFETLETGTLRPEIATRVRNQVSLNILRYFKSKYTFIDDSVVQSQLNFLKKQQNLGCDTQKCYQMIEDNLSPDEKITGSLQMSGNRYTLTLRLLDVSRGGGVVEQKEVSFTNNQLEYFVGEITRALLDTNYVVNTDGAPKEFEPQKIELGSIQFKEMEGVDLKILEFKTQDSKAEGIVSILNPELQQGDTFFTNKNYGMALSIYQNILRSLDNSLSEDSLSSIQEYYTGIQKRIENTKTNLITERLNSLDNRFKRLSNVTSEILEQYAQDYTKERNSLKEQKINNVSILKSILERIRKLEWKQIDLGEKEAESLYDSYNFTDSLRRYETLQKRIQTTDRIDSQEKRTLLDGLEKKIQVIRETGFSYYANQIRSYCNLAEKEMFGVNLKRGKGESEGTGNVKELIGKAKTIILKNRLIDKNSLEYYNNTVRAINRSEEIGTYLTATDIGKGEGKEESPPFEFTLFEKIPSNLYLPGSLHREQGYTTQATWIQVTFWSSLALYAGSFHSYQSQRKEFLQKDQPALDYFVLSSTSTELGALYLLNQTSTLNGLADRGAQTANIGNLFGLAALSIYAYSWSPLYLGGSTGSKLGLGSDWNIYVVPKWSSQMGLPQRELQFGLEGRF